MKILLASDANKLIDKEKQEQNRIFMEEYEQKEMESYFKWIRDKCANGESDIFIHNLLSKKQVEVFRCAGYKVHKVECSSGIGATLTKTKIHQISW